VSNEDSERLKKQFYSRAAFFIFLIGLIACGVAAFYEKESSSNSALMAQLRAQIAELSERPVSCEAVREPAAEKPAQPIVCPTQKCPVCTHQKEYVYVPKKEVVYLDRETKSEEVNLEKDVPVLLSDVDSDEVLNEPSAKGPAAKRIVKHTSGACNGNTIVLANREVLENTTIGSVDTCEIHLSATSYVRIFGHVKMIARKITINGSINGNALAGKASNASSLELEAIEKLTLRGSVDLKGSALAPNKRDKAAIALAKVPVNGGKGGNLIIKGKTVDVVGLINVSGAVPPKSNGNVTIMAQNWADSTVLKKNLLNYSNYKKAPYDPQRSISSYEKFKKMPGSEKNFKRMPYGQ
jgi:hypothetical protein